MKRIYNEFPYVWNLNKQHGTPKSETNIAMEANRPKESRYVGPWNSIGWISCDEMRRIIRNREIANSLAKREVIK